MHPGVWSMKEVALKHFYVAYYKKYYFHPLILNEHPLLLLRPGVGGGGVLAL